MSNTITPATVCSPDLTVSSSGRRSLIAWLSQGWHALARHWKSEPHTTGLDGLSDAELRDIGAPPEVMAQLRAQQEFEFNRARSLDHYW